MNSIVRHIIGYTIGGTLFFILIPLGFFKLAKFDYLLNNTPLISSNIVRYLLSSIIFIIGIIFALWSNFFLLSFGKGGPTEGFGVAISPQTKKLVTTGPYRYSRNPMVFGALSIYTSIVVYSNSLVALLCLIVFIFLAVTYLKFSEEKRLIKDFGSDYLDYKKKVSIIVPLKRYKM
jgi:protein-S-isoprenylcysteine O-methyltransferase Ste14